MDAVFLPLADALGASVDQIKLISCLLISYPLGSVFIRIPNSQPNLKHLFNVFVTLVYFIPVLNLWDGFLQLLADVLVTYYVAKNVKSANMPWIVFALVFGHLTANHIIRAIFQFSYETFEVTGPQMVLVMKLTTFAWNVYDGRRPAEELDKWQTEKRVVEYPSLVEFLGYAFYFPGILVGPYLEFANYRALIDGSVFKIIEKESEARRAAVTIPGRLVPRGRKRVAYRKMVTGLVYLGLFVFFGGQYNYSIAIQDWFPSKSILYRIAIFQVCGVFERMKYYAIWTLTEGAAILTGLGFTGFGPGGSTRWDGAANVKVATIEFAPNMKVLLDSWNMKTNVWLRECVYKRVTPKGKKPGFRSSMLTFATSAFWHGISAGYYLTFLLGGFVQTVGRLCRSNIRPLFLPATYVEQRGAPPPPQTAIKRVYDFIGAILTTMILNYMAAPFMLLTWHDSILGWSRLGWYGHIAIGGTLAFFHLGGTKFLKKTQAARAKKAGVAVNGKATTTPHGSGTSTPGEVPVLPPLDSMVKEVEKAAFARKL
ncbi:MBOAT, membrane-bound O-acyltransferase family-domain-containing protein [Irpex rosettiformis]|uniref:MBOAT, membrane-bound O-acyltransferase family-domain-containing protein n=1 Tax=Irpex rosettiformis TaxID=378272 RepID=A0ACB8UDT1_9APHY|nr:MBOAT, membrane-bound O-acyltransferase family-domain-containing protein [Irpex rosettiformis]